MKNLMKGKKGITLIALVITIIVLLILAGVTIATLTGDNGLLTKAGNAKNTQNDAELEEKLKLAYEDYYIGQHTETEYTFQNALSKTGLNILSVEGNDSIGYEVKINTENGEKVFVLKTDGKVEVASTEWKYNGDGSYTKGLKMIKIGDKVNYDELSNGSKTYTTNEQKGIGGNSTWNASRVRYNLTQKSYSTENLTWRILGINEEGQIELISENPTSEKVHLANEEGYLYGVEELNIMCNDLYGHGSKAQKARSLNIEDINKLSGIKTDDDKKSINIKYGTKWKYRYPTTEEMSGNRCLQYNIDQGNGFADAWTNVPNNHYTVFQAPGEDAISQSNTGYSSELIYDYYDIDIKNKISLVSSDELSIASLLQKGTGTDYLEQWVASRTLDMSAVNFVIFCVRDINAGGWGTRKNMFRSDCTWQGGSALVRPVVVLEKNTELSYNASEGWILQ